MGCTRDDAECIMEQLVEFCRTLNRIRHAPDSASPTGGSVPRLLQTLEGLAKQPVTVRLLAASGIGREVNHPFVRWHANNEVRERSQAVVRSWKELVRTADGYEASQPSGDSRKRKTSRDEAVGPTKRRVRAQQPAAESAPQPEGTASSSSSGSPNVQASASDCTQPSVGGTPPRPAGAREPPPEGPEQRPDGQRPGPGCDAAQGQRPSAEAGPDLHAQLARLTVKQLKGRLEQLRVDHAGCIEKSDLVSLLLATSCEAGTGSEPTTPPQKRRPSWSPQWTVPQLKAKMKEMGMSTGGCTEKADLIAALRRAAGPLRRSGPSGKAAEASPTKTPRAAAPSPARTPASSPRCGSFAKRISMGRKSLLRSKAGQRATTPEAKERASGQRKELRRIERAADDLGVLGLKRRELERMPQAACREAVLQSYRRLCRLVHPDKCPAELRQAATRAFQRLERARESQLASILLPSPF